MSPPCQPFTRQHPATENDPRSNALMHLINSIKKLKKPPKYLALENVIGFEESPTCVTLLDTLESTGYNFMQFDLTPSQFGVPNERPRFYLLAILYGEFSESDLKVSIPNRGIASVDDTAGGVVVGRVDRTVRTCIPGIAPKDPIALSAYLNDSLSSSELGDLIMTEKDLEKNASWCLDIVSPMDSYTSCFTKSYSKYFKGTGSVLLIPDPYLSSKISTNSQLSMDAVVPTGVGSAISESENKMSSRVSSDTPPVDTTIALPAVEQRNYTSEGASGSTTHPPVASKNATSADFREMPEMRTFDPNWKVKLKGNKLRFFSPPELLRLFGFLPLQQSRKNLKRSNMDCADSISDETTSDVESNLLDDKPFFPSNVTNRKCYELIGNSLSVTVVSHLLEFLLKSSFKV
jgi:site-specific DNA-cytosine methylase